jgi:Domain of unknown function (DUF4159)
VRRRRVVLGLSALILIVLPLTALAQRGDFFGFSSRFSQYENVAYDGRFAIVRVRYARYGGWRADYPAMERHLSAMLKNITSLEPHLEGSNVYDFDDPELLKHPVSYLSEPGYWFPSASEVEGLRQYLQKGGFLIVDDFHFPEEWAVFEESMRRVLPDGQIKRLELSHPIFNNFFQIKTLEVPYPGRLGEMGLFGEFLGIYEDNDPLKRLMVVINYNIDLGDYVEWSDRDVYSLLPTNEAYKFMINYMVYGLSR